MRIQSKLDGNDVRRTLKALKDIDKGIVKELRADLRGGLKSVAEEIRANVPGSPPLSRMVHNGPTSWSPTKSSIGFTPGRTRKFRNSNPLVSIRIAPTKGKRGLFIAELAGSRSSGSTAQGRNLISVLNQRHPMRKRGGRFAYSSFRDKRPDIMRIATQILNKYFSQVNRKI